jgi:hypothetical protein
VSTVSARSWRATLYLIVDLRDRSVVRQVHVLKQHNVLFRTIARMAGGHVRGVAILVRALQQRVVVNPEIRAAQDNRTVAQHGVVPKNRVLLGAAQGKSRPAIQDLPFAAKMVNGRAGIPMRTAQSSRVPVTLHRSGRRSLQGFGMDSLLLRARSTILCRRSPVPY